MQFDLSRNIDGAARDVQAAINAARTYLPANLPSNPSYRKINPADSPIMIISLTSNKYQVTKLYDLASTILEQKLSQIQGVGQVGVQGGGTPSVRVEVNPTKLESFGLTLGSVQSVLSLQNSHSPRGQLSNNGDHRRHPYQRPDLRGCRLSTSDHRLSQRRSRPSFRCRRRRGLHAEYPHRRIHRRHQGGGAHHLPPARRQHYSDRRSRQGAIAVSRGGAAGGHQDHRGCGSNRHHPGFGHHCRENAWSVRFASSSWWSSCFCAARAPRSFPSSPFQSRSSAPSPSCICSATRSTTCR